MKPLQSNTSSSCPICPSSQGPLTRQALRDKGGRRVCIWKSEKLETSQQNGTQPSQALKVFKTDVAAVFPAACVDKS